LQSKNLLILAVVGVGLWLLTKWQAVQSFSFIPRGVSFDGSNLAIKLGIVNASSFPLSFNSFTGILYVNGAPVGVLTDTTPQTIAAGVETDVSLNFAPNAGVLITDIVNYISSGGSAETVSLQGSITAENLSIPVNQSFNTPLL
jgi:hypothetical protein